MSLAARVEDGVHPRVARSSGCSPGAANPPFWTFPRSRQRRQRRFGRNQGAPGSAMAMVSMCLTDLTAMHWSSG